jgi:hypothetical protein
MPEPENDAEFAFKGELEDFPEDWLELDRGGTPRLRRDRKAYLPEPLMVDAAGTIGSSGRRSWFLPGKFCFCPACEFGPIGLVPFGVTSTRRRHSAGLRHDICGLRH